MPSTCFPHWALSRLGAGWRAGAPRFLARARARSGSAGRSVALAPGRAVSVWGRSCALGWCFVRARLCLRARVLLGGFLAFREGAGGSGVGGGSPGLAWPACVILGPDPEANLGVVSIDPTPSSIPPRPETKLLAVSTHHALPHDSKTPFS